MSLNTPKDIGERVASLEARMSNMEKTQAKQHEENQNVMNGIWKAIETNRANTDDKYMKLFRLVYMGMGALAGLDIILKFPEFIKLIK